LRDEPIESRFRRFIGANYFTFMNPIRVALCQIRPSFDCAENIDRAFGMIGQAAINGADLAVLPEIFYFPFDLPEIKRIGDMSRLLERFSREARRHEIHLCTGSMAIKGPDGLTNTAYLINPAGAIVLTYSKSHLFEMSMKNVKIRESSVFSAGDRFPIAHTGLGAIGMLICYDIRFPEAARKLALAGAEILIVPADFNDITGPAHWHVMHRSRAIENQVFLIAVSQARNSEAHYAAYGHSMAVSPWGDIIAEADDTESIIYADLDPRVLEDTRKRLPLLKHRRKDLFGE
jgi:omega-amidase